MKIILTFRRTQKLPEKRVVQHFAGLLYYRQTMFLLAMLLSVVGPYDRIKPQIKKLRESYLEVFDKQSHTHSRCTSHRTTSRSGGSCGCWTEQYTGAHQQIHSATHPPGDTQSTL